MCRICRGLEVVNRRISCYAQPLPRVGRLGPDTVIRPLSALRASGLTRPRALSQFSAHFRPGWSFWEGQLYSDHSVSWLHPEDIDTFISDMPVDTDLIIVVSEALARLFNRR